MLTLATSPQHLSLKTIIKKTLFDGNVGVGISWGKKNNI